MHLLVGATGATGHLLLNELLDRGETVRVIVRSPQKLSAAVRSHERLSVTPARLLDLSNAELEEHVRDCDAVASCLGHTISLRGIYGPPRKLVRDATRRLCSAIVATRRPKPVRFVLMNTAGVRNRDLAEHVSPPERFVTAALTLLLPPYADNVAAAEFLRRRVGQAHPSIEWTAVRPDNLVDPADRRGYVAVPSPTRSAIFNAGRTSRANVARFMADLMTHDGTWARWRGQMPVIYDDSPGGESS